MSAPTTTTTTSATITTLDTQKPRDVSRIWSEATIQCRTLVGESEYARLMAITDSSTILEMFKAEGKKGLEKLERAKPILSALQSFHDILGLFCPGGTSPAALVWGCSTAVLEASNRLLSVQNDIIAMWKDIAEAMPRFEEYFRMFGNNEIVEKALVALFLEYIQFCCFTIAFLRRKSFYALIRIGWSGQRAQLTHLLQSIERHKRETDAAATTAHFAVSEIRHEALVDLITDDKTHQTMFKVLRYPRNPIFYGREDTLDSINAYLHPASSATGIRSLILYGMGGIGKTQLALEYCYKYADQFNAIFWVSAETQDKLYQDFGTICQCLRLESANIPDERKLKELVRVWLRENPGKWLLVFDNVDDAHILQDFWPFGDSNGSVLLTSRNSTFVPGAAQKGLEIGPFGTEDSAKLLLSLMSIKDKDQFMGVAKEVGEELSGLPLAISQMAGYMVESHCHLDEFLHMYRIRENARSIDGAPTRVDKLHYQRTLENVWDMSTSRLDSKALTVLGVVSFLDPDAIPENLLKSSIGSQETGFLDSTFDYYSAIRGLRQHCLLKQHGIGESHFFSIHRLVQSRTRGNMDSEKRREVFKTALKVIRKSYPLYSSAGLPLSSLWAECKLYTPHVIALTKEFVQEPPPLLREDLETYASLLHVTSYYLWERGTWDTAWELLQLAERSCDLYTGSNLVLQSHIACGLGVFSIEDGLINQAVEFNEKYVNLRQRHNESLGANVGWDEHMMLSNAYNNLGNSYCAQGRYDLALETHFKSLKIRESTEPVLKLAVCLSWANISRTLQFQGKLAEARTWSEKALVMQKSEVPPQEFREAQILHALGSIECMMGNVETAVQHHEAALEIRKRILGSTNDTAVTMHMLAYCYFQLGKHNESDELLSLAEIIFQNGSKAKDRLARSLFLHAQVKKMIGEDDEAKKLTDQAGTIKEILTKKPSSALDTLEDYDNLVVYMCR